MGLGEIFDGVVREFGKSEAGTLLRANDDSIDGLFRAPEARCRARFMEQQRQSYAAQNSSNNSGGVGSLLLGAAILGGLALFCGSGDDKNKTAK